MKNITIAGRLTKDASLRAMNNGDKVLGFSVAVDDRSGKEKGTLFFDASLFGKRGETLAQYLTKGSSVAVSGDFGTREYDGKTYLTLRAEQVTLLGGKPAASDADEGFSGPAGRAMQPTPGFDDSEIPF
jgi:single-strand DNA-binding protein